MSFKILLSVALGILSLVAQAVVAGCEEWNTREFFESATLAEVRVCLEAGWRVDARGERGGTPLHFAACCTDNPTVITALVEAGAWVNASAMDGGTPLHYAARFNPNPAVITALAAAGADASARDEYGDTPLHSAVWFSDTPAVIRALVEAGADVNARTGSGDTPLHWAALHTDNPAVIEVLLDAGADAAARDEEGKTPWDYAKGREELEGSAAYRRLMLAVGCPEWNTQEFLESATPTEVFSCLATGAEVDTRSDTLSLTPLHYAAAFNDSPTVIAALIGAGAQVNAQDSYGNTPLHSAARYNTNPAVIMTLLDAGADAIAQDAEGKTPWSLAQDNEILEGTDAWRRLQEGSLE